MELINLVGQRFGRLEVTSLYPEKDKYSHSKWVCKCDCGNTIIVLGGLLRHGHKKSCGCLYKESRQFVAKKHGDSKTRLYCLWNGIKARCYYKKHKEYMNYGGRGIAICEEWLDYETFKNWAYSHGYNDTLTIERVDINKNYCPKNCLWISRKQQAWNKTSTVKVFYKNKYWTIKELSEETGLAVNLLRSRIRNQGWTVEKAVTEPLHLQKGKNC